jgi:hypothetical protein
MMRLVRTTTLRVLQEGAELAAVLQNDLADAEQTVERQETDLAEVRVELTAAECRNTDFERLVTLLLGAVTYAVAAAEAPLDVVLHEGRVLSTHRDWKSAEAATPFTDSTWAPVPDPDPNPLGWKINRARPPQLAAPDSIDDIEAVLERLERSAREQLAEARDLEALRSQLDTAVENTETAVAALTLETVAFALHRAGVTEAAAEIAEALSAADPAASIREVSRLLLQHADLFGIDPHASGTAADHTTETKGSDA